MKISNYSVCLVLCISLFSPFAMAQEISIPNKAQRQGMSYEEYSAVREKMRLRMEKVHPQKDRQTQETIERPEVETERSRPDSAYGQGYHSRNRNEDRPTLREGKPEHPRAERFNRGNMIRR